jgi:hypothetical protein
MSAESAAAPAVLAAAIGFAVPALLVAAERGASEDETLAAAGEPTPVIEFVCRASIVLSLCHSTLNFVNTHLV